MLLRHRRSQRRKYQLAPRVLVWHSISSLGRRDRQLKCSLPSTDCRFPMGRELQQSFPTGNSDRLSKLDQQLRALRRKYDQLCMD